jgi:hypothetical protein
MPLLCLFVRAAAAPHCRDIEPMVVVPLDRFEAHGEIPHSADAQRLKLTVSIQVFCTSR